MICSRNRASQFYGKETLIFAPSLIFGHLMGAWRAKNSWNIIVNIYILFYLAVLFSMLCKITQKACVVNCTVLSATSPFNSGVGVRFYTDHVKESCLGSVPFQQGKNLCLSPVHLIFQFYCRFRGQSRGKGTALCFLELGFDFYLFYASFNEFILFRFVC